MSDEDDKLREKKDNVIEKAESISDKVDNYSTSLDQDMNYIKKISEDEEEFKVLLRVFLHNMQEESDTEQGKKVVESMGKQMGVF